MLKKVVPGFRKVTERSQTVFCWKKPPPSNREASAGLLPLVTEHRNAIHFDKIALHSAMSDRFAVICIQSSSRAVQSGQCITFACSAVWDWLRCKVKVRFNKVQSNASFLAHYVAICFNTYMQSSWWKEVLSVIEYGLQYKFAEQGHFAFICFNNLHCELWASCKFQAASL